MKFPAAQAAPAALAARGGQWHTPGENIAQGSATGHCPMSLYSCWVPLLLRSPCYLGATLLRPSCGPDSRDRRSEIQFREIFEGPLRSKLSGMERKAVVSFGGRPSSM